MVLRGQGDSPVRICEPCKKLEDAARFELRHGHKNKAGKGSSKVASRSVDDVLNQILPNESSKEIDNQDEDADMLGNASNSNSVHSEIGSATPDELRQQALDEKNKYKLLKGEGKSAEALKAFKRAKELERQAAAVELQFRKDRRKALASSSIAESQKNEDVSPETGRRDKPILQKGKEKDDLTAELRELGWSDVDIHNVEVKPATTSLEGELLSLIGRDSKNTSHSKGSSGIDKSQVVAMKKKALMLKREGKLAEAKEELKRAKLLEKQLEEQELLGDAGDSDDELSALIRTLDNDKQHDSSVEFNLDSVFDLNNLSGYGGDLGVHGNFDVTDDDMHDPEMAAALQSLGWTEDPVEADDSVLQSGSVDREALADEILNLKKEAVSQKQSGNMAEAMSLLKKAKVLEKDLDSLDGVAPLDSIVRTSKTATNMDRKRPKSKLMIQKELLALKKKALALRREGKLEEADEELKKTKVLEQQLEEMDTKTNVTGHVDLTDQDQDEGGDVTDQDLHDPTYISVLRNLGWQDEDNLPTISSAEASVGSTDTSPAIDVVKKSRRSKAEIQRELLGLKRKALTLRRQGQDTEAEEVLTTAKGLEEQLAEMEAPKKDVVADLSDTSKQENLPEITHPVEKATPQTPLKRPTEANDVSEKRQVVGPTTPEANLSPGNQTSPLKQQILAHKRKALAHKREGKLAEAREELRKAKLLERSLEEDKHESPIAMEVFSSSPSSTLKEEQDPPSLASKPMSSHDRFKLQRECLTHKRNALKLRREGKTEEAEAELELAKKLEAQLEEVTPTDPAGPTPNEAGPAEDDAGVEDLFDPQLLSALKAIGLQDVHAVSPGPVMAEPSNSSSRENDSSRQEERVQLEAQIKAEKVKALNLKRAGKQAEALDSLRRAKQMEKKLSSLPM